MSSIVLSKAVRSNLMSLQTTADLLGKAQERLSSGLRVNTALDNPTNFFTAQSLNSRANDLGQLSDAVSNAVQTVAAADKGITSISKLVASAQATARQALQTAATDPSAPASVSTVDTTSLSFSTLSAATVTSSGFTNLDVTSGLWNIGAEIDNSGNTYVTQISAANVAAYNSSTGNSLDASNLSAQDVADMINHTHGPYSDAFLASASGGELSLVSRSTGPDSKIETSFISPQSGPGGTLGLSNGMIDFGDGNAGDVVVNGQTITFANGDDASTILSKFQSAATAASGSNAFTVSDVGGVLTLESADGNDLAISGDDAALSYLGLTATTITGGSGANPKRAELVDTYNELLEQIDELAKDSGFNGVNLLDGDSLKVLFNEDGSSNLDITGVTDSASGLGLTTLTSTAFDTNSSINSTLDDLTDAVDTLRSQSAELGSKLSIVETRQEYTAHMIDVLTKGASNLTLADSNGEAADVLALQTRQQLSSTALSLASQADQNVLRLF